MMLVEETNVPVAALPVEEFKTHLRLGSGFAGATVQDAVLQSFLRAAIAAIESRTGKVLISRNFAFRVSAWQDGAAQVLPVAPITALTEVALLDGDGQSTIVDPAVYRLIEDSQRPQLAARGSCLPTIATNGRAVVRFTAGYAPDWAGLPADLGQAVMLLAAHYYEYRDETALGQGCMPFGVTSLIERYRMMRVGLTGGRA
ncbi:head-tail connector protein [Marinovum sp. 2_MG-2023]|uniref:head-tail connector protein n=1 Tax=unclassified Marinovum TaxID=2647166 RepID=UPI0026E40D45|nr:MULTISPECIES: head-tail connector protein [unclassified Marinovum]MDO6731021.1 head-tail connector protein [Marinovum sp. 2_MG-2023]MDO6778518.1 head-tail connector protein [Marinovum sp. 1_MG-2023]